MKVLIVSGKISRTETGFDFLPLSQALVQTPEINPHDIFLAPTFRDAITIAKEEKLGINDLIILEIRARCGQNLAAKLIHTYQANLIVISEVPCDNAINNINYLLQTKYKYKSHRGKPFLEYIPKQYGQRPDDKSTFQDFIKLIFNLVMR